MMRVYRLIILVLVLLLSGCDRPAPAPSTTSVAAALGGGDVEGFARATAVRSFRFPQDHGPHPAFRNEWWYITGNLRAADGHRFGFQITFFRISVTPEAAAGDSAWRTNQVWMAHAALSDLAAGEHRAYERFARQALGLAGTRSAPFSVWLEDWRLQRDATTGHWQLELPTEDFNLNLVLQPESPIVLQGDHGLSQKSSKPGNSSYYYSLPRLRADGRLQLGDRKFTVDGLAWLDREWSTSALDTGQAGWDWFSLQLQDGRDLMYYQLRRTDGGRDPHSSGSLSDATGLRRRLDPGQVTLTPLRWWSGHGRRYPIEWQLQLAGEPHPWRVRALLADQEMRLSVRYWEGAVEVTDAVTGAALGRGYLEMAGTAR